MGPTILLDKSALQAIGQPAIYELMRYFYVTVPPVLPLEVLADLEKGKRKQQSSDKEVQVLAKKLCLGGDAFVNVDFRTACVNELLGTVVPMDRVPLVGGARLVETADGRRGAHLAHQPAMDAAWRWREGRFSKSDRATAAQWRACLTSFDPDSFRRSLPPLVKTATSIGEANHDVEQLLSDDEGQQLFLRWLVQLISPEAVHGVIEQWTFCRWKARDYEQLVAFAPYCRHCLKVLLLFHLAFANGLVSTTRSSWVDAEYLCYTPFAQIFCSGDQLHQDLAPFVLGNDQSFVLRNALVDELRSLAEQRRPLAGERAADADRCEGIEPHETSCVCGLWVRHLGAFRPRSGRQHGLSEEERQGIIRDVGPIIEAMRGDSEGLPRRSWPR